MDNGNTDMQMFNLYSVDTESPSESTAFKQFEDRTKVILLSEAQLMENAKAISRNETLLRRCMGFFLGLNCINRTMKRIF